MVLIGIAAGVDLGIVGGESRGLPFVVGRLWLIPGVAGGELSVAVWRIGPKEGVMCTNLSFITTRRCQVSTCQVPDSWTKVLHHRARFVVHSPAWLLGSVHTRSHTLGHKSRDTADHHVRLVRLSSMASTTAHKQGQT